MTAFHTKLLLIAVLLLVSIAGSLAYRNARDAAKEAELAREKAAIQQAIRTDNHSWGNSASTISKYRPK